MKVTVTREHKKEKTLEKYPWLGISEGLVVWFSREGKGVAVVDPEDNYILGESAGDWGEEEFVPFNGKIEIEND